MYRCEWMPVGFVYRACFVRASITPETIDVSTMEKDVQCDDCLFQIVNNDWTSHTVVAHIIAVTSKSSITSMNQSLESNTFNYSTFESTFALMKLPHRI